MADRKDIKAAEGPRALLAGGGSGGHVFPGLAVATELQNRGWKVSWTGRADAMEERLVKAHGIDYHAINARPLVGRGLTGKVRSVLTLMGSAGSARSLIKRLGVRVVLGTGGYVSAPAVLGARFAGVPSLLLEPNAEAGMANRFLSRLATEALLAHDVTSQDLHCASQTTGIPVRSAFFDVAPHLPYGSPLRLLVLGGSQGAQQLNEWLPKALSNLGADLGMVVVRHQTGAEHVDAACQAYRERGFPVCEVDGSGWRPDGPPVQVEVVPFLNDMAGAMAESHLILSRAGAITLAEICAAGRPALLAPLTLAAGHQLANAERLAEVGAAEVLSSDVDAEQLTKILDRLLGDRVGLEAMASAARGLGRPVAAAEIADRVEHWSTRGRGSVLPLTAMALSHHAGERRQTGGRR